MLDSWIGGKAEVVVRAEVDAAYGLQMTELGSRFEIGKLGENALVHLHGGVIAGYEAAGLHGSRPRESSNKASSSGSGFGVVSNFSPIKSEFAPATKHNATASRDSERRPALRRTIAAGIRMRAVAIMRTKTSGSSGSRCPSGVPATLTSALIGTLSG